MNRNIEIKARVEDLASLEELVRDLAGEGPTVLHQEDSFFRVGSGRLKLRRLSESEGELIFYTRPDCAMPAESRYTVVPTAVPDDLLGILSQALGVRGVVRKHRSLYRIGNTRIHLDRVEGLGSFIELEVVLEPHQHPDEGASVARGLMHNLGIREEALVERAYIDLLESEQVKGT